MSATAILRIPAVLTRAVGDFLCWLDRTSFSRSSTALLNIFAKENKRSIASVGTAGFIVEFDKRLGKLGIDGPKFRKLLKQHDCIVSGSFPIQVALGLHWATSSRQDELIRRALISHEEVADYPFRWVSDINVFQVGYHGELCGLVRYNMFGEMKCCSPRETKCYPHNSHFMLDLARLEPGAPRPTKIRTIAGNRFMNNKWWFRNILFDVVTFDPAGSENLSNRMILDQKVSTFDFSFEKTIFDGQSFIVYDWNSLATRECVVGVERGPADESKTMGESNKKHNMLLERVEKYIDRGFTIALEFPDGAAPTHVIGPER